MNLIFIAYLKFSDKPKFEKHYTLHIITLIKSISRFSRKLGYSDYAWPGFNF